MNINNKKPTVLIIDDDSIITTILTKLLGDNYNTLVLNSPKEDYFKLLNNYDISLILLDIQMPDIDGFEVANSIKKNKKYFDIPIIYITVSVDEETILKAFENHASDYIKKPFNKEELKARIHTHISSYENLKKIKKQQDIIYTQAKNTAMKDMLVKISHHWRQPLSAISLSAQSLDIENKLGVITSDMISKTSSEIVNATRKLSDSINFFSELNYNDRYHESQDVALEFSKVIESIQNIYYDDHINLEYTNNFNDEVIKIEINVVNLKNVLMNLVSNSIESYDLNKISNRYLNINAKIEKHHLIVTYYDKAGGVDEDNINQIFDPYFSTKANLNGTGLGLYITQNVIENQYNGTVEAKNIIVDGEKGLQTTINIPVGKILD
jgi:DNA-binding response OmpR family regulator